jgi:hypothetical protein
MGSAAKDILEFLATYWLLLSAVLICASGAGYGFLRWRRRYTRHYTPAEWKSAFEYAFNQEYPNWPDFARECTPGSAQFMACKYKLEQEWQSLRLNYRVRSNRKEDLRYHARMKITGWRDEGDNRDHSPIRLHHLYTMWKTNHIPGRKSA